MKHILSTAAVALLSLGPMAAAAQRFTASQQGCPLDLSAHVASQVKCGNRVTVAFAVEWHGAEVAQLEKWFRLAGCADGEAAMEAVSAVERCQTDRALKGLGDDGLELRLERKSPPARRLAGRRTLDLEARVLSKRTPEDDDGDDADDSDDSEDSEDSTISTTSATSSESTTLSTSTTSSPTTSNPASDTSSNPYVVTRTSGSSTSLLTCMTKTTTTTTYCSTVKSNNKHVKTCSAAPVSMPTCLPGLSCSFSQTTGALSCYEKKGMPVYGKIILAILGLAAAMAISAILTLCCRERRQAKRYRRAAEEKSLLAAMGPKTAGVKLEEVGAGTPQPNAHGDDTAPLMRAEEEGAHTTTAKTTTTTPPHITVSGEHTPTEGSVSFPAGNYDPFVDDHHHRY